MEFKTKAALAEWANDQTMPEIAAYYNGLPGGKPVKKFESREVAVTRIWTVLSPEPADKPKVAISSTRGPITVGPKKEDVMLSSTRERNPVSTWMARIHITRLTDRQAHRFSPAAQLVTTVMGEEVVSSKGETTRKR